jgi:hypothetical protein
MTFPSRIIEENRHENNLRTATPQALSGASGVQQMCK